MSTTGLARWKRPASITAVALGVAVAVVSAGCTGSADKAGGSSGRIVLRLSVAYRPDPDATKVRYFAAQVAKLSAGAMKIDVAFDANPGGNTVPDVEARVAKSVRDGRYELGWIGARAWDELGVTSFQALQAPFLITNYALLDKVVTSSLADEMLAGLQAYGVIGLALVPSFMRHPVGVTRRLVAPSDFVGARIRSVPSRATDALLHSLGATPVHIANAKVKDATAAGEIDGHEAYLFSLPLSDITVTANVVLFGKAITLFVGERPFERLTDEQQAILLDAARRTLDHAATHPVAHALAFESVLLRQWCAERVRGRAVLATPAELAALRRAARPVYRELESDPRTKAFIAEIRALKASLPPEPPITVPASCLEFRRQPTPVGRPRSPSILNGTYRWVLTRKAAQAFGDPATAPENDHYPSVNEAVLRDGSWSIPKGQETGTYRIVGNRVTFHQGRYANTFTFRRDKDGTLHLTPVPPMDRGDQWVWAGAPWRRVGPPLRVEP
jgi:TRAP-type C4-dicarboxylate transport system substrate-binding protein